MAIASCSVEYLLDPDWAKEPQPVENEVIYVIGGLYGNRFAADGINTLASEEEQKPLMIFNGDMHWFDTEVSDFIALEEATEGIKLLGNVEFELDTPLDKADCGCHYPPDVDSGTMERSNRIHSEMKENLHGKDILNEIKARPMTAAICALGKTIAITHGDEMSMAGWDCSRDRLKEEARLKELGLWLEENRVDILATTHTCLPAMRKLNGRIVSNNGSAGMANTRGATYGLITRIATTPHPASVARKRAGDVFVELVKVDFDHAAFLDWFLTRWPEGSPASISYRDRIVNGTGVEEDTIDLDG